MIRIDEFQHAICHMGSVMGGFVIIMTIFRKAVLSRKIIHKPLSEQFP